MSTDGYMYQLPSYQRMVTLASFEEPLRMILQPEIDRAHGHARYDVANAFADKIVGNCQRIAVRRGWVSWGAGGGSFRAK